jgi:hypothetical protein
MLIVWLCLATPHQALAWGQPHHAITRAALAVLPQWQKDRLGAEIKALADSYCMIPDNVYSDKENAPFAAMDTHPGEVYLQKLHLPQAEQTTNLESIRYFMAKAVASLKANQVRDAARYMGTICHIVEDYGSPSHTIPGDNQFTLFQQFMPASEKMLGTLLHGPVENGDFAVSIADYQPVLLGTTVEEAAWRLLHRVHEGIINARSTTLPIIQALYAGDEPTRIKHQLKAAVKEAQILADALHSILSLGAEKFEPKAEELTHRVSISSFWPVEAVHLYYPQSHFFSSPYWGHTQSGRVMKGGSKEMPIRLRVTTSDAIEEKDFAHGISVGMGKPLTFHLPKGVYSNFKALVGLQVGIGDKGRVEFSIRGDNKPLVTAIVSGTDTSQTLECDVSSVSMLQLSAVSRGLDPKSNYAIWAEPELLKKEPSEKTR